MRFTIVRSAVVTIVFTASSAAPLFAQQPAPRPARPTATPEADTPAPASPQRSANERATLPQGFSVVLVLGDIQNVASSDDVPPAARKALTDMREFLPFKSYKLLDAAWLMCCGQDPRSGSPSRNQSMVGGRSAVTQMLRGPEDREYELELATSRGESSGVFVKFTLSASGGAPEIAAGEVTGPAETRTLNRRIADLKDTRAMLEKQLQDAKKKVDVGVSSGGDVPKLELEIRRLEREIEEMTARAAEAQAGRATTTRRASVDRRSPIIDTSFTMDVGETVVVGTSRLKGGSKALIALLTAVPPRQPERKE
jgi:hypothetical protein